MALSVETCAWLAPSASADELTDLAFSFAISIIHSGAERVHVT